MDEMNREFHSGGSVQDEDRRRAEKIKAIKESIRNGGQVSSADSVGTSAADAAEKPGSETAAGDRFSEKADEKKAVDFGENWESELSERISRISGDRNREKKYTPESILEELDGKKPERVPADRASVEPERTDAGNIADAVGDRKADKPERTADTEVWAPVGEVRTGSHEKIAATEPERTDVDAKKDKAGRRKRKKGGSGTVSAVSDNFVAAPAGEAAVAVKKERRSFRQFLLDFLPQKGDSTGEKIRKIVFLIAIAACIVCACMVIDYYVDNYRSGKTYERLMSNYPQNQTDVQAGVVDEEPTYTLLPRVDKLLEMNSEIVGVINIPGTKVNYPVVQCADNDKYLNIGITGKEERVGAIFLDYRNRFDHVIDGKLAEENSDNLIIYGHNMMDGSMFGTLKQYRNNVNYYGEHPIINLNSNYKMYKYKIFAIFIVDAEDKTDTAFECWNQLNFSGEEEFYNFVNEAKRRTIRLNDVDVKYGDKLLTLSTCNGIFGESGPGRLMVMARLVRDGEDPYEGTQNSRENPNIKWPSLYYRYNRNEKYDPDAEFEPYGENTASESEEKTGSGE